MSRYSVQVTNNAGTFEIWSSDDVRKAARRAEQFDCGGGRTVRVVDLNTQLMLTPASQRALIRYPRIAVPNWVKPA